MTCPACGSGAVRTEKCENDYGEYVAEVCDGTGCGWRSDYPEPQVARGDRGACEGCGLPIRDAELFMLWGDDVVTHVECPKEARA